MVPMGLRGPRLQGRRGAVSLALAGASVPLLALDAWLATAKTPPGFQAALTAACVIVPLAFVVLAFWPKRRTRAGASLLAPSAGLAWVAGVTACVLVAAAGYVVDAVLDPLEQAPGYSLQQIRAALVAAFGAVEVDAELAAPAVWLALALVLTVAAGVRLPRASRHPTSRADDVLATCHGHRPGRPDRRIRGRRFRHPRRAAA